MVKTTNSHRQAAKSSATAKAAKLTRVAKNAKSAKPAKTAKPAKAVKSTGSAKPSRRPLSLAEKALLGIVGACAVCVAVIAIAALRYDPARDTAKALERLADDYYVEYLYPATLGQSLDDPASVLVHYTEIGLPVVRLRQLILRNEDTRSQIRFFSRSDYTCDTNTTTLRFYPVAPYGPRDYRLSVQYDCYDLHN